MNSATVLWLVPHIPIFRLPAPKLLRSPKSGMKKAIQKLQPSKPLALQLEAQDAAVETGGTRWRHVVTGRDRARELAKSLAVCVLCPPFRHANMADPPWQTREPTELGHTRPLSRPLSGLLAKGTGSLAALPNVTMVSRGTSRQDGHFRSAKANLPRLSTAPATAPGTPPAFSHFADLTPSTINFTRSRRLTMGSAEARANARAVDIERARAEAEARERAEASFWGYGRKVRPGSRLGLGNRKMPQVPPWVLAPEVVVVLNELDQRSVPLDRVRRETMLGKLGLGSLDGRGIQRNCFGRVAPFALLRKAPMVVSSGLTEDDFPVPAGKSERGCVVICEFTQSEGLLHDVVRSRQCDVLMGNQIPALPEQLQTLLPGLRLCLLSGNGIGNDTQPMVQGLLQATKLGHLTLAQNQIGDDGITRLAQTFNNTTLTSLDLHQNKVGNSGAAAIGCAITKCPCYQVRKCR